MSLSKEELRAWIFLGILILTIGTFVEVQTTQDVGIAVKNTDLIAQCTTPGTQCSKLAAASQVRQQKFFTDLITKANRCLLESAFSGGAPVTGEARIALYDACIARIPPISPDVTTTTVTSRGG